MTKKVKEATEANQSENATATEQVATPAEQGAQDAPARPAAKKRATKKASATKAKKTTKLAKPASLKKAATAATKKAAKEAKPRDTKAAMVLTMLGRKDGATLGEVMAATGWQKHTTRGWVSIQNKKPGVTIESFRDEKGQRTYRLT